MTVPYIGPGRGGALTRPPPQRGGKNSLSRGEGGPRQRVGRGMRAVIYKSVQHNRPIPGVIVGTRSRSLDFLSSSITARIPLQSWKSLLAISMTASPRGKRFRAPRRESGRENPSISAAEKQQDQLQITTSLRARKGVAISLIPAGDCHVGLCPPRNDVVVLAGPSDLGGGCRCVSGRCFAPQGMRIATSPVGSSQ